MFCLTAKRVLIELARLFYTSCAAFMVAIARELPRDAKRRKQNRRNAQQK